MKIDVDALAQEIRRVDGNHSLGAGALAEALMPFLAALAVQTQQGVEVKAEEIGQPVFEFDRYINGRLMAEGVRIEKAKTLEAAMLTAARIASRGPNGETPVLVLRAHPPHSLSNEGSEIDADLLARCMEIVEWKKTGKLPGEHLRRLGQSIADCLGGSLFIDNGLNQAELQTIDEALNFILALSTRKGSAGDGSTITKGCAE